MRGSSLLELLIVVVLTAGIAVVATSLLFTSLGSSSKAAGLSVVKQEGDQAIQLIERLVREASNAKCPGPPLGSNDELEIIDQDGGSLFFSLDTATGQVQIAPGGYLTSDQVEATLFECEVEIGTGGDPDFVRVEFVLTFAPGSRVAETVSEKFQTRVSLRSYE